MRSPTCRSLPSLALLALLGSLPARAQTPPRMRGVAPTAHPEIPVPVVSGAADATAVVLDAANLGFLPSWNAMAVYTWLTDGAPRGPSGGGLYFATPVPYLRSLSVGAAVEWLRPSSSFSFNDGAALSLALAWRPLRSLALGATYRHVFLGQAPPTQNGLDTLDLSVSARLARWAGLALVVHDVPAPEYLGLAAQRVYQAEADLRPLGDDRLELAASVRIGERRGDVDPALRLEVRPYHGLALRAQAEYVSSLSGDELAGTGPVALGTHVLRVAAGLEVNFAHVGLGGYGLFGTRGGGGWGFAGHGAAGTLRVSGDRYPAVWRRARLVRVDLNTMSDRELVRLVAQLDGYARDERTEGIVVVVGDLDGSWAAMEELRAAFARLRQAGKHVYVYAAELDTKSYYAIAGAERVYLDPGGGIRFVGLSSTTMYFKGTLDKLGVRAEFVKIGEYKSAPEQLTEAGPTAPALAQKNAMLDDIDQRVLSTVAADRKMDRAQVAMLRDAGPYTARGALQAGLVDELLHGDEIEGAIEKRLARRVTLSDPAQSPERSRRWNGPAVAVLFVDGDIIEGRSRTIPFLDMRFAGHQSLIEALAAARADPTVEAIVLRVDSPGGSALASDFIAREVERTRAVKPVVCSFGGVAASGGYYVAAPCDAIYADPSTITGSIGIFTGKVDLSGLAERLGVRIAIDKRGAHADMESLFRSYTDEERTLLLDRLRYYYDRFVDAVARGRKLTHGQVDAIGRGHVWTGAQAKEHHLVDQLGGFVAALADAKARAGLKPGEPVELRALPEVPTTLFGQLASLLGLQSQAELLSLPRLFADLVRALPGSLLLEPSTPQARLPFTVILR